MRRIFLLVLLICTFCLPSNGQIREIFEDGEIVEDYHSGIFLSLGDAMFSYRHVYGQYPDDKKVLLDYFLEISKTDESDYWSQADSAVFKMLAERDSLLTVDLSAPENVLTVSGDTCTFSYARAMREYTFYDLGDTVGVVRKLSAVQCIGGPVEQQKKDNDSFRMWARSRAYDKNGLCIWSLCSESPMMPREVNRQFRYIVTMDPYEENEPEIEMLGVRRLVDGSLRFSPVFVPITITRSGMIRYGNDMPRLKGIQLYYQELGKDCSSKSAIGTIKLEDALDPDRLAAIKAYMKDYFDEHEEVDRMELWEAVLFNNPPESPKESTTPAPSDSVLVIVDGIVSPVRFKNNALPPLALALQICPFLSERDIDEVRLINAQEASSTIIFCYNPGGVLLITTREESYIHDFILNGKPVHKRKGIALGYLLDPKHTKGIIKKKWGIKPDRIEKLEVEGKTIRITTK